MEKLMIDRLKIESIKEYKNSCSLIFHPSTNWLIVSA